MIRKLFEMGCFDYQKFILNNLKALSLDNDEAIVLVKLINNYENNKVFSTELIASGINVERDKVEKALTNLLEREFYEIYINYSNGLGEESITIDGFFKKCKLMLENVKKENKDEHFRISQLLQTKLNRLLTSNEMDIVYSLVNDDKYNYDDFEESIKAIEAKKGLISIRQIANQLAKLHKTPEKPQIKQPQNTMIKDFFNTIR